MRKTLATKVLTLSILAMMGCSKKPTAPEGIWLGIAPTKCEPTVWETDYETNSENYEGTHQNSELDIMEAYYEHNGVIIFESNKKPMGLPGGSMMPPCPDCGCSRGYLIKARVNEKDTLTLIYDGFSSSLVF